MVNENSSAIFKRKRSIKKIFKVYNILLIFYTGNLFRKFFFKFIFSFIFIILFSFSFSLLATRMRNLNKEDFFYYFSTYFYFIFPDYMANIVHNYPELFVVFPKNKRKEAENDELLLSTIKNIHFYDIMIFEVFFFLLVNFLFYIFFIVTGDFFLPLLFNFVIPKIASNPKIASKIGNWEFQKMSILFGFKYYLRCTHLNLLISFSKAFSNLLPAINSTISILFSVQNIYENKYFKHLYYVSCLI